MNRTLPVRFDDVDALEDFMTTPSAALADALSRLPGDVLVLGVGGKMGPTLARMAKRAAPAKRVIGVARFSDPALPDALRRHGVEPVACDLLDRAAVERLRDATPDATNVVFMAGHKFGASGNPSLTWAMNVAVPAMVADAFRDRRIVSFSTACVYPFVPVHGPGAPESL
ncbi:MAG: NAD-dependent epimerase/dehydratase family protein [Burkholderiaceae bacterium]